MGSRREKPAGSPWQRYVESAVRGPTAMPGPARTNGAEGSLRRTGDATASSSGTELGQRRSFTVPATLGQRVQEQWDGVRGSAWQGKTKGIGGKDAAAGSEESRRPSRRAGCGRMGRLHRGALAAAAGTGGTLL